MIKTLQQEIYLFSTSARFVRECRDENATHKLIGDLPTLYREYKRWCEALGLGINDYDWFSRVIKFYNVPSEQRSSWLGWGQMLDEKRKEQEDEARANLPDGFAGDLVRKVAALNPIPPDAKPKRQRKKKGPE